MLSGCACRKSTLKSFRPLLAFHLMLNFTETFSRNMQGRTTAWKKGTFIGPTMLKTSRPGDLQAAFIAFEILM